jgi:predicted metalloprotease
MRWWGQRESGNVEYGSGSGGRYLVGGGIGTLIIAAIVYLLGGNPEQILQQQNGGPEVASSQPPGAMDSTDHFIRVVMAQTEDVWNNIFKEMGGKYKEPVLHVFYGHVQSGCGMASSQTGPFYCPADERVYLDKSFFIELKERFNAPGDFANAYVMAHEVGHHVQHLLGTSDKIQELRQQSGERRANMLSVMLELQADFYAGIWAHYVYKGGNVVDPGDIEAALNAASAVGDDRIQQQTKGYITPDAFTHGTSKQRQYWFKKGFETGDIRQGNTFEEMTAMYLYHSDLENRLTHLGIF